MPASTQTPARSTGGARGTLVGVASAAVITGSGCSAAGALPASAAPAYPTRDDPQCKRGRGVTLFSVLNTFATKCTCVWSYGLPAASSDSVSGASPRPPCDRRSGLRWST